MEIEMEKIPTNDPEAVPDSTVNPLFNQTDEEDGGKDHREVDYQDNDQDNDPHAQIPITTSTTSSSLSAKFNRFCNKQRRKDWFLNAVIFFLSLYMISVIFMYIWISIPTRKVIQLYGDSLVDIPNSEYYLNFKIEDDLHEIKPHYLTEVNFFGKGGSRIADLENLMGPNVLHRFDYTSAFTWQFAKAPNAVILYWDSDVNPGPRDGTSPFNNATVATYLQTLYHVLERLTSHCDVVIMSGPTLSGELPRGENELDPALDYYVGLNNATAAMYGAIYVNTRDLFFANLPSGWNQSSGYLTINGEHPNERGTTVLRGAFREALLNSGLYK